MCKSTAFQFNQSRQKAEIVQSHCPLSCCPLYGGSRIVKICNVSPVLRGCTRQNWPTSSSNHLIQQFTFDRLLALAIAQTCLEYQRMASSWSWKKLFILVLAWKGKICGNLGQKRFRWAAGAIMILSRSCKTDEMSVSEPPAWQLAGRMQNWLCISSKPISPPLPPPHLLYLNTFADFPSSSTEMFSFY